MKLLEIFQDTEDLIELTAKAKFNMDVYSFLSNIEGDFNYSIYKNYLSNYKSLHKTLVYDSDTEGEPIKEMLETYNNMIKDWLKNNPQYTDAYEKYLDKSKESVFEDDDEVGIYECLNKWEKRIQNIMGT